MIIKISSFGTSYVHHVNFTRADFVEIDDFLINQGVFLSGRQLEKFVEYGEGVHFEMINGKFSPVYVVTDFTDEYMTAKARELITRFRKGLNPSQKSMKTLVSRAMKVKKVAEKYGLEEML